MQLISSLMKQWAFTPPWGFEATLFDVLMVVGITIAAVLVGVWVMKQRKARAAKSQT